MEILPQIHRLEGTRGAHIYLLVEDTLTLIDTGLPGNGARILDYIRRLGRSPQELTRIILTHYHIDHSGSARELKSLTGARVLAHPGDAELTPGGARVPSQQVGWWRKWLRKRLGFHPVEVDLVAEEGEVLPCLGGLRLIPVPGHTPGSLCLFLEERKVLFCGDAILHNGNRLSRPLPTRRGGRRQHEESLQKLLSLPVEACLFSHGVPLLLQASSPLRDFILNPPVTPLWWRVTRSLRLLTLFPLRLLRPRN
jgi:glyoxylase-like metal-dependent hydrolase (beta-lactamase superfamily II)